MTHPLKSLRDHGQAEHRRRLLQKVSSCHLFFLMCARYGNVLLHALDSLDCSRTSRTRSDGDEHNRLVKLPFVRYGRMAGMGLITRDRRQIAYMGTVDPNAR